MLSFAIVALAGVLYMPVIAGAQSKTTRYTYDVHGRLTFVEDSQNGNRDYDYDHAGNRSSVAVGTPNDAANESLPPVPPAKPTGLFKNYVADCEEPTVGLPKFKGDGDADSAVIVLW